MSTTIVYGRRAADLLVLDTDGLVDEHEIIVPQGHLYLVSNETVGDSGVILSRAGVLELRDVIDRWLAAQQTEAKEDP